LKTQFSENSENWL